MSGWGANTTNRAKPKWLVEGGRYSPDNCYADERGWIYKNKDGKEEVLVAVKNLATKLGGAQITEVYFDAAQYNSGDTASVTVVYTEPVTVVSGTPTLSVTTVSGRASSPYTFTYASGSGTDKLVFTNVLNDAVVPGESLHIVGQTIGGGATLHDTQHDGDTVDTAFVDGDRAGAAGGATYADPIVTGAIILKAAFGAASYSAAEGTLTAKVKYNTAVTVTGVPTISVNEVTVGTHTLTYASGSGTDTLNFSLASSGITAGKTIQLLAQTLGLPGGATITALSVNADVAFASGDRTASDFSGAYADIVVSA